MDGGDGRLGGVECTGLQVTPSKLEPIRIRFNPANSYAILTNIMRTSKSVLKLEDIKDFMMTEVSNFNVPSYTVTFPPTIIAVGTIVIGTNKGLDVALSKTDVPGYISLKNAVMSKKETSNIAHPINSYVRPQPQVQQRQTAEQLVTRASSGVELPQGNKAAPEQQHHGQMVRVTSRSYGIDGLDFFPKKQEEFKATRAKALERERTYSARGPRSDVAEKYGRRGEGSVARQSVSSCRVKQPSPSAGSSYLSYSQKYAAAPANAPTNAPYHSGQRPKASTRNVSLNSSARLSPRMTGIKNQAEQITIASNETRGMDAGSPVRTARSDGGEAVQKTVGTQTGDPLLSWKTTTEATQTTDPFARTPEVYSPSESCASFMQTADSEEGAGREKGKGLEGSWNFSNHFGVDELDSIAEILSRRVGGGV